MKDFVGGNKKLVPHRNSDHCGARSNFLLEQIIGSMKGGVGCGSLTEKTVYTFYVCILHIRKANQRILYFIK